MSSVGRAAATAAVIVLVMASCSSSTTEEPRVQASSVASPRTSSLGPAAGSTETSSAGSVAESTSATAAEPTEVASEAWVAEFLSRLEPESSSYAIADVDGVVTIATSLKGRVVVQRADGSASEIPIDSAPRPGPLALLDGALTMVTNRGDAEPLVFQSVRGSPWRTLAGLEWSSPDQQVSVKVVREVSGGLIAAGRFEFATTVDHEGLNSGPAIWSSTDAITWSRSQVEGDDQGGVIFDVAEVGGELLAVGTVVNRGATWRSTDAGRTWTRHEIAIVGTSGGDRQIRDLAILGDLIVGVGVSTTELSLSQAGESRDPMVVRSVDGGVTWEPAHLDRAISFGLEDSLYDIVASDGAFWTATTRNLEVELGSLGRCYLDIAVCRTRANSESVLLRSTDGADWTEIELDGLDPPIGQQIEELVDIGTGVMIVDALEQLVVYTWPSNNGPPLREKFNLDVLDIPLVEWTADLEIGATYRFRLNTHCGTAMLGHFNDAFWYFSSGQERPDELSWPLVSQDEVIHGFLTLVDESTISYHPTPNPALRPNIYKSSDVVPQLCA